MILDAKITGRALLSLTESRLERSGVSLGFQCTLIDIIENLVRDIQISGYVNLKQCGLLAWYHLYTEGEPASCRVSICGSRLSTSYQQNEGYITNIVMVHS